MKSSTRMRKLALKLAKAHPMHRSQPFCLPLQLAGYGRLVIEMTGPHVVKVSHYPEQPGEPVADKEMAFFVDERTWYPIESMQVEFTQAGQDLRRYAMITPDGGDVVCLDRSGQAGLVKLANEWASALTAEGWLTQAEPWKDHQSLVTTRRNT